MVKILLKAEVYILDHHCAPPVMCTVFMSISKAQLFSYPHVKFHHDHTNRLETVELFPIWSYFSRNSEGNVVNRSRYTAFWVYVKFLVYSN